VTEPNAASPHVLCVGIAVLDNVFVIDRFPAEPTKTFAREFVQTGGGPAANGAVTIARLGGRASLWARVGDDAVGAAIVGEFARERVDASHVRRVPGHRSGVSSVVVDSAGERNITAFADRGLDPSPDWLPDALPADVAMLLCDVRWPAGSQRAMELARARGLPVVLDADLTADDAVPRLIGGASHAIFSAPALARLAATDDIAAGLSRAQALTAGVVGVTRGREGFVWLEGGALRNVPALSVDVVDTLAAGDVFHGAFALALAEGRDIAGAGRFAAAAAALKCTRFGGRLAIPTRAELERFMASA
jgi:sulfofructose kinase